ncbi:hypothetical protein HMPREF0307_00520 [Corynebacterium sp. DNF00584]|nr:hypothetical protein HMPREF0307_00520 [Corynebacterium sp. DNF00584]
MLAFRTGVFSAAALPVPLVSPLTGPHEFRTGTAAAFASTVGDCCIQTNTPDSTRLPAACTAGIAPTA